VVFRPSFFLLKLSDYYEFSEKLAGEIFRLFQIFRLFKIYTARTGTYFQEIFTNFGKFYQGFQILPVNGSWKILEMAAAPASWKILPQLENPGSWKN
jgi:hypothetical protein